MMPMKADDHLVAAVDGEIVIGDDDVLDPHRLYLYLRLTAAKSCSIFLPAILISAS